MSLPGSPLATLPPIVPHVAHLRIGDQHRRLRAGSARLATVVGGERSCWVVIAPMTMSLPSRRMPFSSATPARSTRWLGRSQPKLHHRDEAVAAGKRAGVVAEVHQQFDRVSHGRRAGDSRMSRESSSPPYVLFADVGGTVSSGRAPPAITAARIWGFRTSCGDARTKCVSRADANSRNAANCDAKRCDLKRCRRIDAR